MSKAEDELTEEFLHWYELSDYLKRDDMGFVAIPWSLLDGAPEWCPEVLSKWEKHKAKGFKVP